MSPGLRRRDLEAAHCRNARADRGQTRTARPAGLRIPAQWDGQSVDDVRTARRLAACQEPAPAQAGVTDRHTALDYAQVLKELSDTHFPGAPKIMLVQDNLNTHKPASLYQAFPPAEARRLVERFEWHYPPKHGSWLDMAESELGVLTSQCLNRRIPNKQILVDEIAAWEQDRNANHTKANWHFTTPNARIKLKHLYPSI